MRPVFLNPLILSPVLWPWAMASLGTTESPSMNISHGIIKSLTTATLNCWNRKTSVAILKSFIIISQKQTNICWCTRGILLILHNKVYETAESVLYQHFKKGSVTKAHLFGDKYASIFYQYLQLSTPCEPYKWIRGRSGHRYTSIYCDKCIFSKFSRSRRTYFQCKPKQRMSVVIWNMVVWIGSPNQRQRTNIDGSLAELRPGT